MFSSAMKIGRHDERHPRVEQHEDDRELAVDEERERVVRVAQASWKSALLMSPWSPRITFQAKIRSR